MATIEEIEAFQQALFEHLASTESFEVWWPRFVADPRTACYAKEINRWEPRFLALAQELRRKWQVVFTHHD